MEGTSKRGRGEDNAIGDGHSIENEDISIKRRRIEEEMPQTPPQSPPRTPPLDSSITADGELVFKRYQSG
jgi:hypothetical protein